MEKLSKIIPIVSLIKNYDRRWWKDDIISGLTVGIMLIPQGMAYAMIAGLPPEYGLYTALVPVIIYSILGTSRQLAIGPVAMDSLIVATSVAAVAADSMQDFIATALLLTFMVGLIQILMGVFKMGFLVNFLSKPVIVGFTAAAGIIIGLNQLKYIFGISIPRNAQAHMLLKDLWDNIGSTQINTLIFGVLAIALMLGIRAWKKNFPVALVMVVAGTALAYYLNFEESGIALVGEIPSGFPSITVHDFSIEKVIALMPAAIALALIGFMEAISISKGVEDSVDDYKIAPNQELVAIGASNLIGSFFSSFIVTAGFSRTAVSVDSGAKSSISRLISVGVILLTLFLLTGLFYFLPEVLLGSIIIVAVLKLIDLKAPAFWWKLEKLEFFMYIITLLSTLFIGIQEGILAGVTMSLLVLIYKATKPHMAEIAKLPGEKIIYRNVERFKEVEVDPEVMIIRFDESLFYANVDYFRQKLLEYERKRTEPIKTIIIDGSGVNSVDLTSINELKQMIESYEKRGILILFTALKGPVRDSFRRHRVFYHTGHDHFFVDIENAVHYAKGNAFSKNGDVALQSNHKD